METFDNIRTNVPTRRNNIRLAGARRRETFNRSFSEIIMIPVARRSIRVFMYLSRRADASAQASAVRHFLICEPTLRDVLRSRAPNVMPNDTGTASRARLLSRRIRTH